MVIRHFIAAAFVFIVLLPDTSNSTPLSEERLIHDLKIMKYGLLFEHGYI